LRGGFLTSTDLTKKFSKKPPQPKEIEFCNTLLQDVDRNLFAAVVSGEFVINGFRNHDLCNKLYTEPPASDKEGKQRCTRISRLIAKLRGHGLIAKVKDARLYRITKLGSQVLFAVLSFYKIDFPTAFQAAQ